EQEPVPGVDRDRDRGLQTTGHRGVVTDEHLPTGGHVPLRPPELRGGLRDGDTMPLEFLATPVERLDGAGRAGGPLVSTVPLPRAPRIPQLPASGLCGPREPLVLESLIGVRLLPPGADGATPLDPSVVTVAVDLGSAALTGVEINELGGHVPQQCPVVAGHHQATGVLAQLRGEELESGG